MMSAWLGYFGFLISLMVILLHLAKLKSCGYPYMMPFVGSELTGGEDEKDSIIRFRFADYGGGLYLQGKRSAGS